MTRAVGPLWTRQKAISKPERKWMMQRTICLLMICCFVSGCVNVTPGRGEAICDGTRAARADHAAALAETVDAVALRTGAALIAQLDAGCR